MANYNIVIDTSNFRPYDINPAITILNGYAEQRRRDLEVYDKIAQLLGELATAVGGTEKAKAIWEAYNGDLQAAMADFAQGSNQATGRALSAMRQRYFKDVVPLEKAREAMLKNLELLRNRSSQDGTLLSEKLGNLDTYLENPTYTPRMYSGALLRTQVEGMMQSIADNVVKADKLDNLDPYTQLIVKKTGLDMNTIRSAMANYMLTGKTDDPAIQAIMDSVWSSAGFNSWDMDDATRDSARGWMAQGMYKLAGKKELATQQDPEGMAALNWRYKQAEMARQNEYALQLMLAKAKIAYENALKIAQIKAGAAGGSDVPGSGTYNWYKTNGASPLRENSKIASDFNQYVVNGYFAKDSRGLWVLTKKGLDAYKNGVSKVTLGTSPSASTPSTYYTASWGGRSVSTDYSFRKFINELYGKYDSKDHSVNSRHILEGSAAITATLGRKLQNLKRDTEQGVYNADITSAFSMDYKGSDQKEILKDLIGNATVAKFDKKSGSWVSTGKKFDGSKKKDIEQITQIGYGGGILYEIMYTDATTEMLTTDSSFKSSPRGNAIKALGMASALSTLSIVASRGEFGSVFDKTLKELNSYIIQYNKLLPKELLIKLLTKEELIANPLLILSLDALAKEFRNAGLNYMRGMHVPATALSKDFEDLAKGLGVTADVEDEQY